MQQENKGFIRQCFEKLLQLIVLNVFFLLTCLPVVTLPAGWTALHRSCQELQLEHTGVYRRFWHSVRRNSISSLLPGLLFIVGPFALLYGSVFYYRLSEGTGILLALSCFCLVGGYLLYCIGVFAFQMQAYVALNLPAILKNAVCLTFGNHQIVLGWLLLSFVLLAAIWLLFPYSLPLAFLLGASLPCFAATKGVFPIIEATIVKE